MGVSGAFLRPEPLRRIRGNPAADRKHRRATKTRVPVAWRREMPPIRVFWRRPTPKTRGFGRPADERRVLLRWKHF